MASIAGIRDSRVAAHAKALEDMDRGALFEALVLTSAMVGNFLARTWDGSYDVERTHAYLLIVADRQLGLLPPFRKAAEERPGPSTDGMGSATTAAAFGSREFTQQDPRQWELTWHHQTGGNPRPEHADMDGTTVPADIGFTVDPGIGAPGCACVVEPVNPKGAAPPTVDIPYIDRLATAYRAKLTVREIAAIKEYQLHSYALNNALRDGLDLTNLTSPSGFNLSELRGLLDSATSKGVLQEDITLFRGVVADVKFPGIGEVFTDSAFCSTTPAEYLASAYSLGGRVVEIHLAAGTNVGFFGGAFAEAGSVGETLLSRGLRYTVKSLTDKRVVLEAFNV